jgi:hypothetical protein
MIYVPCRSSLVAVKVDTSKPSFSIAWTGAGFSAGPPIVAAGAVWSVDVNTGELRAYDAATGRVRFQDRPGGTAAHFATPAAANGQILVAIGRKLVSYRVS